MHLFLYSYQTKCRTYWCDFMTDLVIKKKLKIKRN